MAPGECHQSILKRCLCVDLDGRAEDSDAAPLLCVGFDDGPHRFDEVVGESGARSDRSREVEGSGRSEDDRVPERLPQRVVAVGVMN